MGTYFIKIAMFILLGIFCVWVTVQLTGCTIVIGSDGVYIVQDVGIGDDATTNIPKRLINVPTK